MMKQTTARSQFHIWGKKQLLMVAAVLTAAAAALTAGLNLLPQAAATTAAAERRIPIYRTDRTDKVVSLTFDAAWGDEDTPQLIDILGKHGIQATFFVVGEWVDRCPDAVRALHEAGHEIMNHSNTHPHMPTLSTAQMKEEIEACNQKIAAITGVTPILHRAPFGDYNNGLLDTLDGMGMYCIQWDVDSLDWKNPTPDEITRRVTTRVTGGSIVLFHNAAINTPAALPAVIENLKAQGYSFLKASDMIYRDGYTIAPDGTQQKRP